MNPSDDLEVFIVAHDEDIVLAAEREGRFSCLPRYRYVFVGPRSCDRIRLDQRVIVARELSDNIEQYNATLVAFTAWYAIARNDVTAARFVSLLEYDADVRPDFHRATLDALSREDGIVGYVGFPVSHPMFLHATPLLARAIRHVYHVDVEDLVEHYLHSGAPDRWTATSNASMSLATLRDFVRWFEPTTSVFRHEAAAVHVHERAVFFYCLLRGLQNTLVPDVLEHRQERSHMALARPQFVARRLAEGPREKPRGRAGAPFLSIIVVAYDMLREVPRTLQSLQPGYQRGVTSDDYEVLVVDNGSRAPLSAARVESYGPNYRYIFHETNSRSPVGALNVAATQARGEALGLLIDGARMVTPGMLKWAIQGLRSFDNPVVSALGWHLGPDVQYVSAAAGYDRSTEDQLLASAGWEQDGYQLFAISALAGSSQGGLFQPIAESNSIFVPRNTFAAMGGFDERFDLEGGGFANVDFYYRACTLPGVDLVILLGEGSFHQFHEGVTTSGRGAEDMARLEAFARQYELLRGHPFAPPRTRPIYLGTVPPQALHCIAASAAMARNSSMDPTTGTGVPRL